MASTDAARSYGTRAANQNQQLDVARFKIAAEREAAEAAFKAEQTRLKNQKK